MLWAHWVKNKACSLTRSSLLKKSKNGDRRIILAETRFLTALKGLKKYSPVIK